MSQSLVRAHRNERQLRHLTRSERLEEAEDPLLVRLTLISISACIIGFVFWASIANINEVARAPGEVVPQGFQQSVQDLEGGTIRQILVQEGQAVEQGQTLIVMDGNGAAEDLRRTQQQQVALELQRERLRASLDKRQPDFSRFESIASPAMIADQKGLSEAMNSARGKDSAVIHEQIAQKAQTLRGLESRQATITRNLSVSQDMYDRRKALQANGYVSHMTMLQAEKDMNELQGESAELTAQEGEARGAMQEYTERVASLDAGTRDDAYKQLEGVETELEANAETLRKAQDRVARLTVRAPVRGLVKGLTVNTVGGVVQPGQVLMDILPLDQPLVAEIKIPPAHIGHIHAGQPVQLKISAYDFSRYGALPGTLDSISPSTFEGEQGERFYKGRVTLIRAWLGHQPGQFPLMPGMTVMADIVTGDKTVMDYLLKPIALNMKTAFTER
jgi:adhesin transport system membrane fusion protein